MGSIITPYKINVPDSELEKLRMKLNLATLPGETSFSNDRSYGVRINDLKRLVKYWQEDYDWRKAEAKLNELPHFTTTIAVDDHADSLGIHFIHQKSEKTDSIPLLFCHGCKILAFISSVFRRADTHDQGREVFWKSQRSSHF
jgi:hypothetical protein